MHWNVKKIVINPVILPFRYISASDRHGSVNAYKTCYGHNYGRNDFGNIYNSQRKDGRQQERLIT